MSGLCNGKSPISAAAFGASFVGISPQEKCGEKPWGKYGLARYLSERKDSKLVHMGLKMRGKRFSVRLFNIISTEANESE
jgi:hypothetical protein